jgi:uncharacterized protein YjbI with pentapeptide repeats
MKHLFTLLLVIAALSSYGQEEKKYDKVISYSEFEELLKSDINVQLANTYVKMDLTRIKIDQEDYVKGVLPFDGVDVKYRETVRDKNGNFKGIMPLGILGVNIEGAYFQDCKFDQFWVDSSAIDNIVFNNCEFGNIWLNHNDFGEFSVWDCTISGADLSVSNCNFKDEFNVDGLNFQSTLYTNRIIADFGYNSFTGIFLRGDFKDIIFEGNKFNYHVQFDHVVVHNRLNMTSDTMVIDSFLLRESSKSWVSNENKTFYYDKKYNPSFVFIEESDINQLDISDNTFLYEDDFNLKNNIYNYSFEGTDIEELNISNEEVYRLNFNNTVITKVFSLDSVKLHKDFSARGIELPEYNIDFDWILFKDKLNFQITDSTNFKALTPIELSDKKLYNEYITSYKKFFSVYKNKGDLKSANACYAEMKDVETRRLKYLSDTEGGTDNFLNYQLNVFLKYFAEYGTSPIKSVKISGWVILIFACFYFFFYSDWDQINRKFLIGKGEILLSYFKSEQKLEDLYSEQHKDDLNTFSQFKQNLKDSKAHVPFFFMLFLKPLYWVAIVKLKANKALYKRIEFLQGRWIDLSTGKKFFLGALTFCSILTYGVYLIVIRSLNSLILSINTFTTLGFGDIPVVGISRYVAILEGFLGWFLLSIFSVSLISQIIQN